MPCRPSPSEMAGCLHAAESKAPHAAANATRLVDCQASSTLKTCVSECVQESMYSFPLQNLGSSLARKERNLAIRHNNISPLVIYSRNLIISCELPCFLCENDYL